VLSRIRKCVLDPVDVVTGEVYWDRTDFTLPGPIPIKWSSFYSNQFEFNGSLGWRWIHAYEPRLIFKDDTTEYLDGLGQSTPFRSLPPVGTTVTAPDGRFALRSFPDDWFGVALPTNLILYFRRLVSADHAKLLRIVNRNGIAIKLQYTPAGALSAIHDSAGRFLAISNDSAGRIVLIECSRPGYAGSPIVLAKYRYDESGNLTAACDAGGAVCHFNYDTHHQLIKRTEPNGYSFHYRYHGDRCIETFGDDGLFTGKLEYQPARRRTILLGFDGRRLEYRYDNRGNITEEVDPYGRTARTLYDPLGNVAAVVDRCGRTTVFQYDERCNKIAEISPTGAKTTWAYDQRSRLIERSDPKEGTQAYEYDDRDNLLKEIGPGAAVTTHAYDGQGHRVLIRAPGLAPQEFEYDRYHQLVTTRDPISGEEVAKYTYDLLGNILGVWDESGWAYHEYDGMGRLLAVRHPDGTNENNTYDHEGNILSFSDRLGNAWHYEYIACGLMTKMVAPDGGATEYQYTKAAELSKVVDANGNITDYLHDLCDEMVEIRRNGAIVESYHDDSEGRPLDICGPRRVTRAALAYEIGEGPTTKVIFQDDQPIQNVLEYDAHENVLVARNQYARIERTFDGRGRLVSDLNNSQGVSRKYDPEGRVVGTAFYDQVHFSWDYEDGAVTLTDPLGGTHTWILDEDRVQSRELASGIMEFFSYDEQDRICRHVLRRTDHPESTYLDRRFTYDALGRLTLVQQDDATRSFEYDGCGRLTQVLSADRLGKVLDKSLFRYDLVGNLLPAEFSMGQALGAGNQLFFWSSRQYLYDENGCVISENRDGKPYQFHYDSTCQLVSVQLPDGTVVRYEYDPLGRRISKRHDGAETKYGWDGDRLSSEEAPDGTLRCYVYAGSEEYSPALFCDARLLEDGSWAFEVYSLHYDEATRPCLVTDQRGRVVWSAKSSAYGLLTVDAAAGITLNLRAPGQYYDVETGLHYNYHRCYDPVVGRFLQPDPIDLEGGLNLYGYGDGDPFSGSDPLGLAKTCKKAAKKAAAEKKKKAKQQAKKAQKKQAKTKRPPHKLTGEVRRNGKVIRPKKSYQSGGTKGKKNQFEALETHTERKFLKDANSGRPRLKKGDHLAMEGEYEPCKPGCQPAIRDTVRKRQVTAEYKNRENGNTHKWKPVDKDKPLKNSKGQKLKGDVVQDKYDKNGKLVERRRYWKTESGKNKSAKMPID